MKPQTRSADHRHFRGSPRLVDERYELGELIGVGGSAEVYRALDRRLGREVAIKLYAADISHPARSRRQRELAALSGLHHPHLVELLDAGEADEQAFLVMPLVDGETLADRLRDGALPPEQVVAVGAAIADALGYIHDHGITHRDVKPANVLLGDRVMLSDFGIAQLLDATRITASGNLVGTAAYMAPEQVRGQRVGPPADIYALGLVMLEALTARREYHGPPAEAAVARLVRTPVVPTRLPSGLGDLLRAMTATDPGARPSAPAVANRLRAQSVDVPALPPTAWEVPGETTTLRLARPRPRRHMVLASALLGVVLIAALAVALPWLGPAAAPVLPPSLAVPTTQGPPPSRAPKPNPTVDNAAPPPARSPARVGVDPTGTERAVARVARPRNPASSADPDRSAPDRATDRPTGTETNPTGGDRPGQEDTTGPEPTTPDATTSDR